MNQVTAESETAAKTIEELRKYIGNKLSDSQLQRLEEEIQRVKSENEQLKETCKVLESTNELLNVRLSSLSNVLHIQETEMSRNDIYLDGEKASVLLKKWREKVYALLVQLKAQEISENEELRKLRQKVGMALRFNITITNVAVWSTVSFRPTEIVSLYEPVVKRSLLCLLSKGGYNKKRVYKLKTVWVWFWS